MPARIHIPNRICLTVLIQVQSVSVISIFLRKSSDYRIIKPRTQIILLGNRIKHLSVIAETVGTLHPTGGSKLGKAVNYAQNHHDTLMNYMLDGRCEISNNRAERKAKSYAVGRKSFLFHTSEAGAGARAVMYSIVETAKANILNIFQYLYTVLLYMPDYMNSSAGIEQLMPWSDFIKEQCTGIIDVESNVPENRIPLPCR